MKPSPRLRWLLSAAAITILGVASRSVETGFVLADKYLGDALYAALFYCLGRVAFPAARPFRLAVATMVVLTAIELFQLTLIPAALATSPNLGVRLVARLLGTHFAWLDLAAYAVGVIVCRLADSRK